jgi:hypothetical protein
MWSCLARALGIEVPNSIQLLADEVIEQIIVIRARRLLRCMSPQLARRKWKIRLVRTVVRTKWAEAIASRREIARMSPGAPKGNKNALKLAQSSVARQQYGVAIVIETIAVGRLDPMVDLEDCHPQAVLLVDGAVFREFLDICGDTLRRQMLFLFAAFDVGAIGLGKCRQQIFCPNRTDDADRRGAVSERRRRQPSGQQQIGEADRVV